MNVYRNSPVAACFLVALIISLVVNFSYLLLLVVNQNDVRPGHGRWHDIVSIVATGRLSMSVDGFGYIVTENGDSIYVDRPSIRRLDLKDGDILEVQASSQPQYPDSHYIMRHVNLRNGLPFDYGALYNGTSRLAETMYQILYYLAVSFVMLLVMNRRRPNGKWVISWRRSAVCAVIIVITYFLAPITLRYTGETILLYQGYNMLDFVVMTKCVFIFVVVLLYSQMYILLSQRQQVVLENERLTNENLTTKYNMLVNQINPHFFFNSLNSLSMLVREKDEKRALKYLDQLAYTFRYTTQNGNNAEMVSLHDELQFADAYCYLYKIRYADKIFFDFDIDESYMDWTLPALSLQPLIENAVKHNAITSKNPFHVRIYAEEEYLVVANERRPMLEPQIGTGTGLKNLGSRNKLILGRDIEIISNDREFIVKLPLKRPSANNK